MEPREELVSGSARRRADVILTADEAVRRCGLMVSPWAELFSACHPPGPGSVLCVLKRRVELEIEAGENGVQRSYFQAFIEHDRNLEITREAT